MAMRFILGQQEKGAWNFDEVDKAKTSTELPSKKPDSLARKFNSTGMSSASRDKQPRSGFKRSGAHGRADISESGSAISSKRIKVEDTSDFASGMSKPMFAGFVDLTGDISDDEISSRTITKTPSITPVPSVPESAGPRTHQSSRDEDRMTGIEHTPVLSTPSKAVNNPFEEDSSDDEDAKPVTPVFPQTPPRTDKPKATSGPFQLDDSSDEEGDISPVIGSSSTAGREESPIPQQEDVLEAERLKDEKEKAEQRKKSAELREQAKARRAAKALEQKASSPVVRGPLSPPSAARESSLTARKPTMPTTFATGRKVEPGRLPPSTSTSSSSGARNATLPGPSASGATRMPSMVTNRPSAFGTSQGSSHQPISRLGHAMNNGTNSHSTNKKQNGTMSDNSLLTDYFQKPSSAAQKARSQVEKLRQNPASPAQSSNGNSPGGLSREQNVELFGEEEDEEFVIIDKQVVIPAKPKQFINLAAEEDSLARFHEENEKQKAVLAEKLNQTKIAQLRQAELRRRLEEGKTEKERKAQEAALEEQRKREERSRLATKQREQREEEERRAAEERRVAHAKLQAVNREKRERDQETQRKRQAEEQERAKEERIRKRKEIIERNRRAAETDAAAEAALQDADMGELVLEGPEVPKDTFVNRTGEASTGSTGPVSLDSARGAAAVRKSIVTPSGRATGKTLVEQRVAREKSVWDNARTKNSTIEPNQQPQGLVDPFFTRTPARKERKGGHTRKLYPILPEDASMIQWRDRENMEWKQIVVAFEHLTGKKYSDTTLRNRYRLVSDALKEAKVQHSLVQKMAAGELEAELRVNQMLLEMNPDLAVGGGPTKLAPLDGSHNPSPAFQTPTLRFQNPDQVVRPQSILGNAILPADRPTTGGKSLSPAMMEIILRAQLQPEHEEAVDAGEETSEDDMFVGFEDEYYVNYAFQVQRRQLSREEAAEEEFTIDNEEWMPCGDTFTDVKKANAAANAEVLTVLPDRPCIADPIRSTLELWQKDDDDDRLQHCNLVSPHGMVQTRVAKVLQAPRVRVGPPSREQTRRDRAERQLWHINKRFTITPPEDENDLFGENAKPVRTVEARINISFSDRNLANKRAAQIFVDHTFRSASMSLDLRTEEKRTIVERYLGGILADELFEGEMELTNGMEGNFAVRKDHQVEPGSKVKFEVWLETGVLAGPLN